MELKPEHAGLDDTWRSVLIRDPGQHIIRQALKPRALIGKTAKATQS